MASVSDDFNRADENLDGNGWEGIGNQSDGEYDVVSNTARINGTVNISYAARFETDLDSDDHSCQATIPTLMAAGSTFRACGPCARCQTDDAATFTLYYFRGADGSFENHNLEEITAGSTTTIASSGESPVNGQVLKVVCNGDQISGEVDDVEKASGTNSAISGYTRAGIYAYAALTAVRDEASLDDWSAEDLAAPDRNVVCTTEALTLTENVSTVNRARGVTASAEVLTLTENASTVNRARTVGGVTEALTLTENASTVNRTRAVAGSIEALTLTENPSTVNRARGVSGSTEALTLTELASVANRARTVAAATEALTLTELAATVTRGGGRTVTCTTEALTLVEAAATVNRARVVAAASEVLTLTELASVVNRARNVTGATEGLTLMELAAAINRARGVAGLTEVLTLTENVATITKGDPIGPVDIAGIESGTVSRGITSGTTERSISSGSIKRSIVSSQAA